MDDLTLRYYEAEMRYLREAGKEFARAHPDRAAMLNLDKPGARDPYVERLFEGFAFLMGRLREKLDDDLPELTEGLVSLLWPHYMRTIPSLAIVEFTPDWRSLRQAETLAEGFSVLSRPIETENFRLHCAPVINLFTLEADPLTLNPLDNEYLLRPLRLQDGHTEIYSVDNIHGAVKNGKHPYVPFTSFRHRGGMMRHDAPERYYHTRVKRGPSGLYDTWLILGGRSFELEQLSDKLESLSMRITGTNGQLPRKALESTLLDRVVKTGKVPVRVLNVTAPTMPLYPPANDRFHWRVMSHLGSNFLSMMDNPEVLRGTLALYDWTDDEMNRRRLEAIVAVKHTLIRRFEKGFMLRGVDIEVTLNTDNFAGEGDVNLFGEMLHRFFALYADIHLFNQLTLVLQPTGKRLRWRENHSQHVPG
ncbi:type VI secretion system baseplate subunit TssF [Klebsiella sp. PL-2018]|uniref:type VI secretion system baseplate subunit TssF n=1 Tax=Klebsiella sp. PL-2018 TaxID=2851540 RepID=UPI001C224E07|nr:Protein ImpG/VasA [Klebsiella sp. PL-2018]